ncbi:hypothetical protein [Zavarzinia sp. CC-PAN008]|uniref:hypothetical protein n=1 Tax=Zavarzinia sp. CC-PAN008 TaxID=3243332 RepID=UPI003F745C76
MAGFAGLFVAAFLVGSAYAAWWWSAWSPELAGPACPSIPFAEALARKLVFERPYTKPAERHGDILTRALDGEDPPDCFQVADRQSCSTQGPRTLRVFAGDVAVVHIIPAGRHAELRNTQGLSRCVLLEAGTGPR